MSNANNESVETQEEMSEIISDFSQFYIFLLLSEAAVHGYGLIKSFKKRTGRTLSAGTLYPFLQKLQQKGLISQSDMSVGRRPKLVYTLTERGSKFTEGLFRRFAAMTASAIEPNLETCASCGVRVYEGGHHEEINGQTMAFCCSHCAAAFKHQR